MDNQAIAGHLEELADLLEIQGEAVFKLRAYRTAARSISEFPVEIADLVAAGRDLMEIGGIGKSIAEKCTELVQTGRLRKLDEILLAVPRSVLDFSRIPKVGPKKAATLFRELGVTSLEQLRLACENHQVRVLDGFGEKTEAAILKGISQLAGTSQRLLWAEADAVVQLLLAHMRACPAAERMEMAGSYRRGRETVGDLDLLVVSEQPEPVIDHFVAWPEFEEQIGRGPNKCSIRTRRGLQIDLRVLPAESFGAALQYFTGSKDHNIELRKLARKLHGWKLNEYGVFDGNDRPVPSVAADEAALYQALDLQWITPELREARGEIELASRGELPELVRLADIRGDLHMHTTATDGRNSIEEMAAAARLRGLQYIAITDHSRRVTMARGLDPERLLAQWAEIDRINQTSPDGFRILRGIECDILEAGGMDLPDEILAQADWVIASLHYGQNQPRQQITDRLVGALKNPHVWIVAHPTGRLIGRRPPCDVDMTAVYQAAAENRKFLELNSSPSRLDLDDVHCIAARKFGIPIAISTDAHQIQGLDDMKYGLLQARRAGLTCGAVANTLNWEGIRKLAGRT